MSDERAKDPMVTVGEKFDLDGDTIASSDEQEPAGEETELAPGTKAGRYLILDRIGRGGMGVVYQAFDPELDRRIALKVLRVTGGPGSLGGRARERLLREAKALAQLSHPNVVSAYDVGTIGDDVFVAMELVEGWSFKAWLREKKPTVYAKVAVLLAAGRGIAAAHEAGLVHRDIKPDNIIVGEDGRVRVLDFGLARAAADTAKADAPTEPQLSGELNSEGSFFSSSMTLAGAIVGTPGYMAPEQYRGEVADEQSDQFSLCVTLYEALYGQRPFVAKRYGELKEKVLAGQLDPLPAEPKVPASYRKIALRGLSTRPADRYASMAELLAELAKDPRATKRRVLSVLALLLLVTASFVGAAIWQAQQHKLCAGAADRLGGVWDQEVAAQTRAAFLATGRPYAEDTFRRTAKLLADYSEDWVAMRTEACAATQIRGEQSAQLLDLRMHCLDRRLHELGALTHLFAAGKDVKLMNRAVRAVTGLTGLAFCADAPALSAAIPPPADAATRIQVEKLRRRLDEAAALGKAGRYQDSLAVVDEAASAAQGLDFAPLQAEIHLQQGALQGKVGQTKLAASTLRRAYLLAAQARDDRLLAWAAKDMLYIIGYRLAQREQAQVLGWVVEAAVARAGKDPELWAEAQSTLGIILAEQGKLAEAQPYFERCLALREKHWGPDHLDVASARQNLGNLFGMQGKSDQALEFYRQTLAARIRILGPHHPEVGTAYNNLCVELTRRGELDAAQESGQQALAIWTGAFGPNHADVGSAQLNLAHVLCLQGKQQAARQSYLQVLKIWQAAYGPAHPDLAFALSGLGDLDADAGQHPAALIHYQKALAIREQALGAAHPLVAESLTKVARSLIGQGQVRPARDLLERALAIHQNSPGDPIQLAATKFRLAQALGRGKTDRALALACQAQDLYRQIGSAQKERQDEIVAWIKSKRGDFDCP